MDPRQHTLGHLQCAACEEIKQALMYSSKYQEYLFPRAAALWLESRKKIGPRSRKFYQDYIRALTTFFGEMALCDIHIGNVVAYQEARQAEIRTSKQHKSTKRTSFEPQPSDGASLINHEISCLGQILARGGLWDAIKRFYEPLPLPRESVGIALTPEEERHFFQVGMGRKRWQLAAVCNLLSVNTTATPSEIRFLKLRDVELEGAHGSFLHIDEGVKNEFRKRPVPLGKDASWCVRWLLERAAAMGACEPEHYLLPHRAEERGGKPDPTRPMGSWKRAHYEIRKEAGKKFPRLLRLRRYDFRHTACTDMLEDPSISFTTIEHMMGHRLSSKTKRKYDHVRNEALRQAAAILDRGHAALVETAVEKRPAEVVRIDENARWARG